MGGEGERRRRASGWLAPVGDGLGVLCGDAVVAVKFCRVALTGVWGLGLGLGPRLTGVKLDRTDSVECRVVLAPTGT